MRLLPSLLLVLLSVSCSTQCYTNDQTNYTDMAISKTTTIDPTYGFEIDDPNNQLDVTVLDSMIGKVVDCMRQFKTSPATDKELTDGYCWNQPWVYSVRPCLVVKVPLKWEQHRCTGPELDYCPKTGWQQTFTCSVPAASCEMKGETITTKNPCACRATIQGDNIMITTPNLFTFSSSLVTLMTGCENPWTIVSTSARRSFPQVFSGPTPRRTSHLPGRQVSHRMVPVDVIQE